MDPSDSRRKELDMTRYAKLVLARLWPGEKPVLAGYYTHSYAE